MRQIPLSDATLRLIAEWKDVAKEARAPVSSSAEKPCSPRCGAAIRRLARDVNRPTMPFGNRLGD